VKGPLLFAAGDTPRKMGICTSTQAHTAGQAASDAAYYQLFNL